MIRSHVGEVRADRAYPMFEVLRSPKLKYSASINV